MEENRQDDILVLIARDLAGVADPVETIQLREWIGISESNRKYFENVKNIWDASAGQPDIKMINTPLALKKVLEKSKLSPRITLWHWWQRIAAVIIFPLAIGMFMWIYLASDSNELIFSYNEPVYNEVYAAFGTRSALKLADGTLFWLNSGSSLRYPDKFNGNDRRVYLKGEGYFEVKSDVDRPFFVSTPTLEIKATGTKFNVQDYDSDAVTGVTLVSGKLFVNEQDNSRLISELSSNQHLYYNRQTGTKSIVDEDTYKYISWKDGKLIFRNDPFSDVAKKLSQVFNVDIEIQDSALQDYRYRATFQDESLEEILKLLKYSSPVDFRETKRIPLPDGSFPKKKVTIFLAE